MTLLNGEKLNDKHINYAQRLLCNQFPNTQGLGDTLLQKKEPSKKIESGLQIIHSRGDHWVMVSTITTTKLTFTIPCTLQLIETQKSDSECV